MNDDAGAERADAGPPAVPVWRRAIWLLVLIGGIGLFEAVRQAVIVTGDPNLVPTLLSVGALVIPASFVAFLHGRPASHEVTGTTLGAVAVAGGVIGVVGAAIAEYDTLRRLGVLAMLGVAVIEESSKLLVPLGLLVVGRWRKVGDGLLIGVACGAGFATLETMGYAFVALVHSDGDIASVQDTLVVRGVLSPAGHMAWTGITAAALWYAARQRFTGPSILLLAGAFGVAIALHTAWDGIGGPVTYGVVAALGLALLTGITHHLSRTPDRSAGR